MLDARFVQVVAWPGARTLDHRRARSKFATPYAKTLTLLEREIRQLGGRDILLQTFHPPADIKLDGWPRASANRPRDPGVIVTFANSKRETLSFPCDRYTQWEDNLRAIALSLEALRTVDRYGVTRTGEQYRGFAALPPAQSAPTVSRRAAVLTVAVEAKVAEACVDGATLGVLTDLIRDAQRNANPDKGGTPERFARVQKAAKVLRGEE
jgi:hypothetical protein